MSILLCGFVLAICALTACNPGHVTPTSAPTVSDGTERPPRTSGPPDSTGNVLPEEILGDWSSSGPTTEIVYRFLPDGRYRSVEILSYPMTDGVFEFRRVQSGDAQITGNTIVLQPSRSTRTRVNPEDPAGDYTDREEPLDPRTFTWRRHGSSLHLVGSDGLELILGRP